MWCLLKSWLAVNKKMCWLINAKNETPMFFGRIKHSFVGLLKNMQLWFWGFFQLFFWIPIVPAIVKYTSSQCSLKVAFQPIPAEVSVKNIFPDIKATCEECCLFIIAKALLIWFLRHGSQTVTRSLWKGIWQLLLSLDSTLIIQIASVCCGILSEHWHNAYFYSLRGSLEDKLVFNCSKA